ncbi:MAG: phosphomethylpyrimidine synthase ThiC [Candidatus Omnitrophica bacterium]|nr:phosphomethylpyrimidine synthase ThiC [Candidatus Omnitrophota bacterium]
MTQLEFAKKNKITPQMRRVAKDEGLDPEYICENIKKGRLIIPANRNHRIKKLCGIGAGLRTKVNANIGTSPDSVSLREELRKLKVSVESGADTIMDLSTGGNISRIRKEILKASSVPVGTVPIYEAICEIGKRRGSLSRMNEDDLFKAIEAHAKDGVDFITVHCGVTLESVERLKKEGRIMDVVSRGGAFLIEWMLTNKRENPLYERYDKLLEIAKEYDVTLSLGDGMRPGALADATDRAQVQETILLGELAKNAQDEGVQVMIEGPGHVPMNQIEANVLLEKRLCHGAPFYVLGPLVTDIAPGYDHITSAIGGAIAAMAGADFLCYVTPSEHLRLPNAADVKEGVIAARIAAHAADIAKGVQGAIDWDIRMSKVRKKRDWKKQIKFAIDKERPERYRRESHPSEKDVCTMCSTYCSMKAIERALL